MSGAAILSGGVQGKVILDIGCNNGYYLYQAALQNPKFVLGVDPVIPYYLQFRFLQKFCPLPNVDFKLIGVDELLYFEKVFDVVFCLGILYHHTDPIGILKKIFQVLRPGGLLIVESEGIDREGSYFLLPQGTYLKTPGHWFIPTAEGLANMIRRSGFQYVDLFLKTQLTVEEQRRTVHAPYECLGEGLDPNDSGRTREGHAAPWRFYVKARRACARRGF